MTVETDLHIDTRLFVNIVNDLDKDLTAYEADDDLSETIDADLVAQALIEEATRVLTNIRKRLGDKLGAAMGEKRRTVMGAGTWERNYRREGSTKCTDEHGLWRQVLDTRIVDETTGEVLPQSEVIRRAYGAESKETGEVRLTGASPSKVEALGIDPDDFFEKGEVVGWTLKFSSTAPIEKGEAA